MKKLFLFICFFVFIFKVDAKTYYSDYGKFSEYQDELIVSTDLVDVEEIKLYQLYKENISYGYYENSQFKETGKKIKIETPWVSDINLIDKNKEIEEVYSYEYYLANKYSYLNIVNESKEKLMIESIEFFDRKTGDILFKSNNILLNIDDIFSLDIGDIYNLSTLGLNMTISGNNVLVSLYASYEHPIFDKGDYLTEFNSNDKLELNNMEFTSYDIYGIMKKNKIDLFKVKFNNKDYITYYRNIYYLKEYEIILKEYIDEYSLENRDVYKIDLDRFKYNYRYRTRDKVIINDNNIIDNKDKTLLDFIEYSTIPLEDIKVTSNINYDIDGCYSVKYELPFITIDTNVIVDLFDDKLELDKANFLVNKKNLEIKELIISETDKYNKLVDKFNNCLIEKDNLKYEGKILKDESNIKKQSTVYIYLIILMILLLLFCRKKLIEKND